MQINGLWDKISQLVDIHRNDETLMEIYNDFCASAIKYAHMRAEWFLFSLEQKHEKDSLRTSYHDRFIVQLKALLRYCTNTYSAEFSELPDDRKVIGDFACFVTYQIALSMR